MVFLAVLLVFMWFLKKTRFGRGIYATGGNYEVSRMSGINVVFYKFIIFDVYPPLHGIGCAEAESPYPDENTEAVFEPGMCVNTDISLFGLPGGSNRIEEGFVITEDGAETLFPFMRKYYEDWLRDNA